MQNTIYSIAAALIVGTNSTMAIGSLLELAYENKFEWLPLMSLLTSAIAVFCFGQVQTKHGNGDKLNGN